MELKRIISKFTILTIIGSSFLGFSNLVSAEHITVDKDNPAINAKNNLLIEKEPDIVGLEVSGKAIDESRATVIQGNVVEVIIPVSKFKTEDEISVKYKKVGTYLNEKVDVKVTFKNIKLLKSPNNAWDDLKLSLNENLYNGFFVNNASSFEMEITFYDQTNKEINLDSSYITFNSLNESEFADRAVPDTTLKDYTTHDSIVKYDNVASVNRNVYVGKGGTIPNVSENPVPDNFFEDVLGAPTFKRGTVSFEVKGTKQNFIVGSGNNRLWFTLNSATLFNVQPEKPTKKVIDLSGKDINKVQVRHGQEISYLITQKVNILGQDLLEKYKKFIITDSLPKEVTYLSAELVDEKGTVIPNAGTISLDKDSNTLTFTGNDHLLKDVMVYEGESYSLKVNVRVD